MTFEGDREARFEDPDFDPDAYLASVVDLGSKPPPESAPFAFAASARDAFAAARATGSGRTPLPPRAARPISRRSRRPRTTFSCRASATSRRTP